MSVVICETESQFVFFCFPSFLGFFACLLIQLWIFSVLYITDGSKTDRLYKTHKLGLMSPLNVILMVFTGQIKENT